MKILELHALGCVFEADLRRRKQWFPGQSCLKGGVGFFEILP